MVNLVWKRGPWIIVIDNKGACMAKRVMNLDLPSETLERVDGEL